MTITANLEKIKLPNESATPTFLDESHGFSIGTTIDGAKTFGATDKELKKVGQWRDYRLRGTALRFIASTKESDRLFFSFRGEALSVVLPVNFEPPGPNYKGLGNHDFHIRIDDGQWQVVDTTKGREVLVASDLGGGEHSIELQAIGDKPIVLESIRVWESNVSVVRGTVIEDHLLGDLRVEVSGPVSYSRSVRDSVTGNFSLVLPKTGEYTLNFKALGFDDLSFQVEVSEPGQVIELGESTMIKQAFTRRKAKPRNVDNRFKMVCLAHVNIWGQESAEWLQRRVKWINEQNPDVVLNPNEVNPVYVEGAFKDLECPWLTCTGNHSLDGFDDALESSNRVYAYDGVKVLSVNKGIKTHEQWEALLSAFGPRDRLRILSSFEPHAPRDLLAKYNVKFYFYGHHLEHPPCWKSDGTTFLRKIDANTFYSVAINNLFDTEPEISIQRSIFPREV